MHTNVRLLGSDYTSRLNVQSAARYSRMSILPISTLRNLGTINLRNLQKRFAHLLPRRIPFCSCYYCLSSFACLPKIKPLTEEEKKQKLEELRVKMAEKKTRKAAEDAKENKANELIRRKAGQVSITYLFLLMIELPTPSVGLSCSQRRAQEQAVTERPRSEKAR